MVDTNTDNNELRVSLVYSARRFDQLQQLGHHDRYAALIRDIIMLDNMPKPPVRSLHFYEQQRRISFAWKEWTTINIVVGRVCSAVVNAKQSTMRMLSLEELSFRIISTQELDSTQFPYGTWGVTRFDDASTERAVDLGGERLSPNTSEKTLWSPIGWDTGHSRKVAPTYGDRDGPVDERRAPEGMIVLRAELREARAALEEARRQLDDQAELRAQLRETQRQLEVAQKALRHEQEHREQNENFATTKLTLQEEAKQHLLQRSDGYREQLGVLQQELSASREESLAWKERVHGAIEGRKAAEEDLSLQRKRRVEAEAALDDLKREVSEPFMLPALLETFMSLSRMTTQAMTAEK